MKNLDPTTDYQVVVRAVLADQEESPDSLSLPFTTNTITDKGKSFSLFIPKYFVRMWRIIL